MLWSTVALFPQWNFLAALGDWWAVGLPAWQFGFVPGRQGRLERFIHLRQNQFSLRLQIPNLQTTLPFSRWWHRVYSCRLCTALVESSPCCCHQGRRSLERRNDDDGNPIPVCLISSTAFPACAISTRASYLRITTLATL